MKFFGSYMPPVLACFFGKGEVGYHVYHNELNKENMTSSLQNNSRLILNVFKGTWIER